MTQHTHHPGTDPQVGDVIAGKYKLERLLGAGGMGTVFSASHLELDRLVAVKFVHAGISENPEINARFLREARAVVKIESEHVAQVIDVGHLPDQTPFMVMEYLDGCDLSEISHEEPMQIPDAVDYLVQACSAMLEAHHKGIVHRDLKPANLFLTHRRDGSPVVKVLDFGISKWVESEPTNAALTNPSVLMGSPAYMSPEQLKSARDVDHRTDIWSLGVILYELLAGRPAFDAESLPLLMTAIMRDEPVSLRELRPDVDAELEATILHCLKKKPSERYQSVAELASALAPWAPVRSHYNIDRITKASGLPLPRISSIPASMPRASTPPAAPAASVRPARDETAGTWVEEPRAAAHSSSNKSTWVLMVAIATAVVGVGAFVVLTQSGPSASELEPVGTAPTDASGLASAPPGQAAATAPVGAPGPVPSASVSAVEPAPSTTASASATAAPLAPPEPPPPLAQPVRRPQARPAPAARPPAPAQDRPDPKPAGGNPLGMELK